MRRTSPIWNFLEFFIEGMVLFWLFFLILFPFLLLSVDYLPVYFLASLVFSLMFGFFMDRYYDQLFL